MLKIEMMGQYYYTAPSLSVKLTERRIKKVHIPRLT